VAARDCGVSCLDRRCVLHGSGAYRHRGCGRVGSGLGVGLTGGALGRIIDRNAKAFRRLPDCRDRSSVGIRPRRLDRAGATDATGAAR